jgi:hypothetical protein
MERSEAVKTRSNEISSLIIGAAIEVHRHLGPGLLESAYESCLCYELELRKLSLCFFVPSLCSLWLLFGCGIASLERAR